MRKKTLASFAAVYAVICLTYGAINGSRLPGEPDITEDNSASESSVQQIQTTAAETTAPETAAVQSATSAEQPAPETVTTTTVEVQTEATEQTVTEKTRPEEEEQQIEEYTEPQAKPSLEEYLSRLRCGGCHHGCYLLNPRCMRGARKQSYAESEYYSLYG